MCVCVCALRVCFAFVCVPSLRPVCVCASGVGAAASLAQRKNPLKRNEGSSPESKADPHVFSKSISE